MNGIRLGVDLGGTKIEIAALDARGAFVLRERMPTPQGDYAGTLVAIARLVATAEARLGATGQAGRHGPAAGRGHARQPVAADGPGAG